MSWRIPKGSLWTILSLWAAVWLALGPGCRRSAPAPEGGAPGRVVTLTPSATRLVAALGAADRLVGVDRYSAAAGEVPPLPSVGDFLAPNVEAIAKLRPDLVILDAVQNKARASLEPLGIAVLSIEMHSIADVRRALGEVGRALGTAERSAAAIAEIDRALEAAASRAANRSSRPRVLWVMDRQPGALADIVAAGPGSFASELLEAVGADNAMVGPVRYPKLSRESLIKIAPAVVIDASGAAAESMAAWSRLELGAAAAWRAVPTSVDLATPGPGVAAALREVERLVFGR
jgi:iron complex transport system substrate-binding protein